MNTEQFDAKVVAKNFFCGHGKTQKARNEFFRVFPCISVAKFITTGDKTMLLKTPKQLATLLILPATVFAGPLDSPAPPTETISVIASPQARRPRQRPLTYRPAARQISAVP